MKTISTRFSCLICSGLFTQSYMHHNVNIALRNKAAGDNFACLVQKSASANGLLPKKMIWGLTDSRFPFPSEFAQVACVNKPNLWWLRSTWNKADISERLHPWKQNISAVTAHYTGCTPVVHIIICNCENAASTCCLIHLIICVRCIFPVQMRL